MDILLVAVVSALNIVCFFVGAKVGQTVSREEKLHIPGPVAAYKAHTEAKEVAAEKNRLDVILGNIERYDGTGKGQEDVPRG